MINRRYLLGTAFASVMATSTKVATDKDRLIAMLDQANIPFADPSDDRTPNAISIKVDGQYVIGIDGHLTVFVFSKAGRLLKIILWKTDMSGSQG